MEKRLELHAKLVAITPNVYFQPPNEQKLEYPCIVYSRDSSSTRYADNSMYLYYQRYSVTVIDREPDSDIPEKLRMLPMCEFNRWFASDRLNHDVYDLFY